MTSPSSGYFKLNRNATTPRHSLLERNVSVPTNHVVMASLREKSEYTVGYALFRCVINYDQLTGRFTESTFRIWERYRDVASDFVHMFNASRIIVQVAAFTHTPTRQSVSLFFSFFHGKQIPQKLASGFWNCSVDNYASFQHHLLCNHKTECEDGRDETEHCPFSSAECQGLVAFCNSCYKFVTRSSEVKMYDRDLIQLNNDYCVSLGGRFNCPICVCDWFSSLKGITNIHFHRLQPIYFNFYSNDMTLPAIYRNVILRDSSVLYHHINGIRPFIYTGQKTCYRVNHLSTLRTIPCMTPPLSHTICEFKPNKTHSFLSISITSKHSWDVGPHSMTRCLSGHVTHTFLLCGFGQQKPCGKELRSCYISDTISNTNGSIRKYTTTFPTFACNDNSASVSYTLVCDFITDCYDDSDESMCKHPACVKAFTCTNGQCIPYSNMCDQVPQCRDESDENCHQFREVTVKSTCLPSPVLISFNGINKFILSPMTSNQTCPESHYRCPGQYNDCLPVYTRCNRVYDCIDHQDEEGCKELTCVGFFRCRLSAICVHSDNLCDNWSHCPMHDDELLCDIPCPVGCLCQGHSFLCLQPFRALFFPRLRYLDATDSGMTLFDVNNHSSLFQLVLAACSLTLLPDLHLLNLRTLDLRGNQFQYVNLTRFLGLQNLQELSLSDNPLMSLFTDHSSEAEQCTLRMMDLSYSSLKVLESEAFSSFSRLEILNLTSASIHIVSPSGFQFTKRLTELHMAGNPVKIFPLEIFTNLFSLQTIFTDNHKLCCSEVLPQDFDMSFCYAPKDEMSSCKDLLQSWTYRGFLWLVACLSVTGNIFCLGARLFSRGTSSSGFSVFVTNLSMADCLMGVYIVVIGTADEQFRGKYLHYDDRWKSSAICEFAGCLSMLSSEVSALIIWLITLDRFVVLHFPFSSFRFERTSAAVASLLTWLIGWGLALLPLLPFTSHWEFYSQTGICIPLPVNRQEFKGKVYAFSVFIILNFFLFLCISAGQALIYWSIQRNTLKTNTTKMSQDLTIARRLITVAVTDFLCWFPIGICGMLALTGTAISQEVNVALAIFVLPLNSAVNPFMYTFNTLVEKREKANEGKLVQWLECHTDLVAT